MVKDKFKTTLDWSDFQSLGNSDNVPEEKIDIEETESEYDLKARVRIYLERKGRGGKVVSIIKGLNEDDLTMSELCKLLKSKCGVGGSVQKGEILIQGDQRKRLINELHIIGFCNVKNAGA